MGVSGVFNFKVQNIGIDTFTVNQLGDVTANSLKLNAMNTAPASATATGTTGEGRTPDAFMAHPSCSYQCLRKVSLRDRAHWQGEAVQKSTLVWLSALATKISPLLYKGGID